MTTTNHYDTFIAVADDSSAEAGLQPTEKNGKPTIASLQYEMIIDKPYAFSSDDVLFAVHVMRKEIATSDIEEARSNYFSKGQPCFRASPLTKQYGWGVHSDRNGKIALYGVESDEYSRLKGDSTLKQLKAMRTQRKS